MNLENKDYDYNPTDIVNEPMTPEEEAQDKAESEDLERCMKLGSGHDPKFDSSSAQLMARGISEAKFVERDLLVNVSEIPEGATQIGNFTEVRRRYDSLIQVTALDFSVEKLILMVNGERQIITADLSKIGPPKMKVTWGFLAQLLILTTVCFAL
jgi:hypothetical protein